MNIISPFNNFVEENFNKFLKNYFANVHFSISIFLQGAGFKICDFK